MLLAPQIKGIESGYYCRLFYSRSVFITCWDTRKHLALGAREVRIMLLKCYKVFKKVHDEANTPLPIKGFEQCFAIERVPPSDSQISSIRASFYSRKTTRERLFAIEKEIYS